MMIEKDNRIDIFVATHKPITFELPNCYKVMQVNAENCGAWEGYQHDNDYADNISAKNASFCELTVLYMLWKHSDAEYKGLAHYRRYLGIDQTIPFFHFVKYQEKEIAHQCITPEEIESILHNNDIILPQQSCPFPLTAEEDLERFCYKKDIDTLCKVVEERHPSYVDSLRCVLGSKHTSYCNMFVTSRSILDEYCEWLFDILFELEKRIDISDYTTQRKRIFGYMAEFLLNVFVDKKKLRAHYLPIIMPEDNGLKGLLQEKKCSISSAAPRSAIVRLLIKNHGFRLCRYTSYIGFVNDAKTEEDSINDPSQAYTSMKRWGLKNVEHFDVKDGCNEIKVVYGDIYYGVRLAYLFSSHGEVIAKEDLQHISQKLLDNNEDITLILRTGQ